MSAHPDRQPPSPDQPSDRLGSWKEIAAYLGRDIRTVQRWEQTQGLPVHRHQHNRLSTAYALKSELDAWWHNRPSDQRVESAQSEREAPGTTDPGPAGPPSDDAASRGASVDPAAAPRTAGRGAALAVVATVVALIGYVGLGGALTPQFTEWSFRRLADPVETGARGGESRRIETRHKRIEGLKATAVEFAARDYVLVIPFENRTGDTTFDGTAEYALESELAASAFVNVVPRQRVRDTLELMQRPLDTRLDLDLGHEVALRDGQIKVLLAGRVEQFGGRYALTADIRSAASGMVVASVREEAADASHVLPAIRRLSGAVRARLGEALASIQASSPSIEKVSTTSLRALQLYSRAWDALGWTESAPIDRSAAAELLRQAIALDPEFAHAHMLLANVTGVRPEEKLAMLPHVDKAVAAAQRVPELERLLIEARAHAFRASYVDVDDGIRREQSFDRARAALGAVLSVQPDHFVALDLLLWMTMFRDSSRAWEPAMRYADLRPTSARAQVDAARLAMRHGDVPRARHFVERARALDVPVTHYAAGPAVWLSLFDAEEAWIAGEARRAAAIADAFEAETRTLPAVIQQEAATHLFFANLSLGRLAKAEALVTNMPTWIDEEVRDQQRGRVIALRGNRRVLAAFLEQRFRTPKQANFVASNLIDAGLLDKARAVIAYHRQHRNVASDEWYAGQLALAEGRIDDAIRRLTAAAKRFPARNNQGLKIARQLADAHHMAGRPSVSLQLLEDATRQPSAIGDGWEWLRTRDRLAQRYREAGRVADAVAIEQDLSRRLAIADDDHAIKRRLRSR